MYKAGAVTIPTPGVLAALKETVTKGLMHRTLGSDVMTMMCSRTAAHGHQELVPIRAHQCM
jgi:hypothetical protein